MINIFCHVQNFNIAFSNSKSLKSFCLSNLHIMGECIFFVAIHLYFMSKCFRNKRFIFKSSIKFNFVLFSQFSFKGLGLGLVIPLFGGWTLLFSVDGSRVRLFFFLFSPSLFFKLSCSWLFFPPPGWARIQIYYT